MLSELRVRNLGVIDDVTVVLGPGMTVLSGETGAGKTLVVEAIDLLLGGRAEPTLVAAGASEAVVEGRFSDLDTSEVARQPEGASVGADDSEVVLRRTVPASGRSRAYVDGQMASVAMLTERARALVDLHGQHAHQSLLSPAVQRRALDRAGRIDTGPRAAVRDDLRAFASERRSLGGDARARARELDLLRFQVAEIDATVIVGADEEQRLSAEQASLGDVSDLRQRAAQAHEALRGERGALDGLADAVGALTGKPTFESLHARLVGVEAELADVASEARHLGEGLEDDPSRLEEVSTRIQVLADLRRKYGDTLAEVLVYADEGRRRVEELQTWERRAAELDRESASAEAQLVEIEASLGVDRRAAAPLFAAGVESELRRLAMPSAHFSVRVGADRAGDEVTWMLAANPGSPPLPLRKVASGGELARTMLAVRLVLSGATTAAAGPPPDPAGRAPTPVEASRLPVPGLPVGRTLIFDEVDAGVGGQAAVTVGAALSALAAHHQVLVVTHLPQVAAFADRHLAVTKRVVGDRTVSEVVELDDTARVVELSRMLSGRPGSQTARRHAEELLAHGRSPQT